MCVVGEVLSDLPLLSLLMAFKTTVKTIVSLRDDQVHHRTDSLTASFKMYTKL
jgi:hypothetical protein